MYGTVRTVVWEGGGRDTSVTRRALPDWFHQLLLNDLQQLHLEDQDSVGADDLA